jgi:hypothetical protein
MKDVIAQQLGYVQTLQVQPQPWLQGMQKFKYQPLFQAESYMI